MTRLRLAHACMCLILPFVVAEAARAQDGAVPPGISMGGSVGVNRVGGGENDGIGSGVGWEAHIGATTRFGLSVRGGLSLSSHDLSGESTPWQYRSFYVEPRLAATGLSPTFAPFVAGRLGYVSEKVPGRTWELMAAGRSWGAGAGVVLRVAPQISIETGMLFGATRFDAYRFVGELAWKSCLDSLDPGTPLPASVTHCSGSRSIGGVVNLCYPPYYPERTSNCDPPEIPYIGTGRRGSWTRFWLGVNFALISG